MKEELTVWACFCVSFLIFSSQVPAVEQVHNSDEEVHRNSYNVAEPDWDELDISTPEFDNLFIEVFNSY